MTKTNAMRMLDRAKIKYDVLQYDYDESDLSGVHAAAALSLDPNQVFKTLVTRGGKNGLFVFCIPVGAELDLKKCAKCAGVKSLEMIHVKELISLTGYMRGGCSPIGMKKQYPTFIDSTASDFEKIVKNTEVKEMAEKNHIDVWNECLRIIENLINPQMFNSWFKPLKPVSLQDSTITIEVPSDFYRKYLEDVYLDMLKKTLKRVIGPDAKLVYKIRPVRVQPPMTFPAANVTAPVNKPVSINTYPAGANPGAFVYPGLRKFSINPRLNPVYCFGNLVEGECNKMGITAGESISSSPGNTPFNPLFLFGSPGLGKTHLSQAIGIAIKEKYPDQVVLYVTGNEFKTQYMDAVNVRNKLTDFLAFYMKIDVLIVDDIQDLLGPGTQNAFFNVFNHLHENGKQLIFTSDRAPADLKNFEERLLSRLKWGLSVELQRPSYATRLEMLKARSFREGVTVSEEVLEYLATRIKSNFRELEGALISLIAHATLIHKEMTVELAEKITGKIVGEEKTEVTIDKVQKTVCDYFNITKDTLLSKSRKRQIVQARQIAMYMSRTLVGCSLSIIGTELGGKDHATVLHACNTVSDLMSTDKSFKQYVSDIEKMLVTVG